MLLWTTCWDSQLFLVLSFSPAEVCSLLYWIKELTSMLKGGFYFKKKLSYSLSFQDFPQTNCLRAGQLLEAQRCCQSLLSTNDWKKRWQVFSPFFLKDAQRERTSVKLFQRTTLKRMNFSSRGLSVYHLDVLRFIFLWLLETLTL